MHEIVHDGVLRFVCVVGLRYVVYASVSLFRRSVGLWLLLLLTIR